MGLRAHQVCSMRFGYRLGAIADAEFAQDVMDMVLYCQRADFEQPADFLIGLALCHPAQNFGFTLTEDTFRNRLGRAGITFPEQHAIQRHMQMRHHQIEQVALTGFRRIWHLQENKKTAFVARYVARAMRHCMAATETPTHSPIHSALATTAGSAAKPAKNGMAGGGYTNG